MATQYAFVVNSDACSGCKTCQVACKDRHDLPAGVHNRRIYEVTAGGWQKKEGIWASSVVAYNLSVACHHCAVPLCNTGCASDAIWKRPDGIVLIDESRCTRCRKCEADCPYGSIRWDASARMVRKCDFCVDDLERGLPPACVIACPNRALEYGNYDDLRQKYGPVARVFPLPDPAAAGPALFIVPHRLTATAARQNPEVANWEEL
jgi:anaerobic dimethyl sulfoxide reductase subunit B (iron-sulfur subunit)